MTQQINNVFGTTDDAKGGHVPTEEQQASVKANGNTDAAAAEEPAAKKARTN